ncbi:MAG: arylamine N-acetyltransferase [Vicinamibacteria bacterium]
MDLDSYFKRIGYAGSTTATIETLRALHNLHIRAIPFENLDVLQGRRIEMAPKAVVHKLVTRQRGGYCFEQNTLFKTALTELGFAVQPLLGRVRRNVPADVRTGLTHMVLRVTIDDRPWLCDVGFGSLGSPAPLTFELDVEQTTQLETRRLVKNDRAFTHQAKLGEEWVDLYQFTLDDPAPVDFELGNWYSCTHPEAHFRNNLVVTLVRDKSRLAINNNEFVVRQLDGSAEKREIRSRDDLLRLLVEHFNLPLDSTDALQTPWLGW